ncbi:MAG: protein-export chaperone SecB [Tannerella sp.]|nr:protein-export chaperone SecB [Tannerella sp.]
MFPYIREHITNISLKGGIGAIILPPVNFTKIEKK